MTRGTFVTTVAAWTALFLGAAPAAALELTGPGPIGTGPLTPPPIGSPKPEPGLTLDPGTIPVVAQPVTPPRFQLRFPFDAPDRVLCAPRLGQAFVRKSCKAGELQFDPSALALCRNGAGVLALRALACTASEKRVDLRAVRGMNPRVWLASTSAPRFDAAPGVEPPAVVKPPAVNPPRADGPPALDGSLPFDIGPRDELCRTKTGTASLRRQCAKEETPLDPASLVTCIATTGALSVRAVSCKKTDETVDLRDLAASRPVGIGPLVGILPQLADLAMEYPNG
jgi:hypothetical protein